MNSKLLFATLFCLNIIYSHRCGTDLINKKPFKITNDKVNNNKRRFSNEYTPIKIKFDFTQLATQVNAFELQFFEKVFSKVGDYFSSLLLVQHDNIQLDRSLINNNCDIDNIGGGFERWLYDYDVVIFPFKDYSYSEQILAAAMPCLVLNNNKPVGGVVGLSRYISMNKEDSESFYEKLLLHELSHALGFHPYFFQYLNLMKTEIFDGYNISYINSPKVLEKAKIHFNCPNIKGIEIENQGGEGSVGAHWESRYMLGDYMISTDYTEIVISDITLALFEDLGFYKVNYYTGGLFRFGKNQGCSFLEQKCIQNLKTSFQNDFCLITGESFCGSSHISRGICAIVPYEDELEEKYQYFGDSHLGGAFSSANYCPVSYDFNNEDYYFYYSANCKYGYLKHSSFGEKIGDNSLCFESSLIPSTSSNSLTLNKNSICYEVECDKFNKEIILKIGSLKIICPGYRIGLTNPDGFYGEIMCPDYNLVCSSEIQCNDMLDCIEKKSTSIRSTYKYLTSFKFDINFFLYFIFLIFLI